MDRPLPIALAIAFVFSPAAVAQTASWQIPDGGAARYHAKEVETCKGRKPPHEPAGSPRGHLAHVTILLATELTPDRRATKVRFVEPRWLAPRIAFDLTTFGEARNVDFEVDDFVPFARVRITGKVSAADENGRQQFELKIQPSPAARRGAEDEDSPERRILDSTCRGTLSITRRFDRSAGVITDFTATLVLSCDHSSRYQVRETEYRLEQTWTLREVLARRQAGFEARVADAVRRGTANLRTKLAIPNRQPLEASDDRSSGEGHLALGLLALLHAELPPDDAVVRQGFEELRRRSVRQTYPLSLALMATERLYAPRNERDMLLDGRLKRPAPRMVAAEDKGVVHPWARALLANRDDSVRPDYVTRWSYEGPHFDNSNTQYGVLGLHSAHLCNVDIGRTTWFAVASHWLAEQCPAEGPTVGIELGTLGAAKDGSGVRQLTVVQRRGAPRGWSYRGPSEAPYGSMTAAGISSLTIALSHLQDGNSNVDAQTRNRIEQAIRDGFVWLSKWRAPRIVPSPTIAHSMSWWYYWLYGLERACELSNVGLVDGHDWYHDHALLLLELQYDDGSWGGSMTDTAWAILFLKKAQMPVFTGPR